MTPLAKKEEHINRCYLADLSLDNPITNGHTTTCDLLWSGCPVITFPISESMPSRVATSICNALDIGEEAVCNTYTEYATRAKEYALSTFDDLSENEKKMYV